MGSSYNLKRKGVDLSQGSVIETPFVPDENAPSSSGWHSNLTYRVHEINPTCTSHNPNLTIIFFHGIIFGTNDAWKETWTIRPINNLEEYVFWPEKWLPEDLNDNVRILSLSYDSYIVANFHNDVTESGKDLVQSLITNSSYQSLWDGPVALVAYSFGGFILKSLMVEARKHVHRSPRNGLDAEVCKHCNSFLNNVKGIIFYGVPHGGTQYLSNYFSWQHQQINIMNMTMNKYETKFDLVREYESFRIRMEYLSRNFQDVVHDDLKIYAFAEGLPLDENWGILVPYASAIRLSNNNHYKIEDANHLTICKPPNKDHASYSLLLKCLRICMKKNRLLPPLPCHEVALIDKTKDINILLQKESIVGLVGMGGIGKTILNKKFYHFFHNQYDKSSFLKDDSLLRHPSFSFEDLHELPNIIKGVPSQDLELVANSLMDLQILISQQSENPIAINELQCQYLLEKFCDTLTSAKACIQDASLQHVQKSHIILKSLARLAQEAKKLVHDCCDPKWIQAAMIFANAKEHFASLTFKVRLYMELLQSIFKEGATKEFLSKLHDRKWIDDIKDKEFQFIDEKAMEDRQKLLSRLIEVGSSASKNLIKRLEISFDRTTFLHENATNVIDAWKVEYKSIHRVPNGQIGKGGFATVRKVTWLGNDFAEKCFHGPKNDAMQNEASLLAGLSHPNILPLFCCVTRDFSCSLVMELMDRDLCQLMEELMNNESEVAPFELLEAVDIMLQVAEGMNYLHQNRVIHRDLKSNNILVKYNERDRHVYAKVADFGLSKIKELSCTYSNLTMDLGTTRWMAPELFGDSEDHDVGPSSSSESNLSLKHHFKVDVYSFGMVCYEILTGCVPFFNIKLMDLRKRIKDGLRPDMPEECPEQLSTLVRSCYHPDPEARPSFPDICVELRHIMCSLMVNSTS